SARVAAALRPAGLRCDRPQSLPARQRARRPALAAAARAAARGCVRRTASRTASRSGSRRAQERAARSVRAAGYALDMSWWMIAGAMVIGPPLAWLYPRARQNARALAHRRRFRALGRALGAPVRTRLAAD